MTAALASLMTAVLPLGVLAQEISTPAALAALEAMQTGKASPFPTFAGTVYSGTTSYGLSSELPEEEEPTYKKLASLLEEVNFIPRQRHARFAYHNQVPAFRANAVRWSKIDRWRAELASVDEGRDGWLVTVCITPNVVNQWGGPSAVFDYYFETYYVTRDGKVSFVGFKEGTGGMMGGIG